MTHKARFGLLVSVLAISACERPTDPTAARAPEPSLAVGGQGQPAEKVGAGVWAALDRGESPAIVVALNVAPSRDLATTRRNVAATQDDVLRGVRDEDLHVRRLFAAVPALSALARNRGAVMRLAADARVARVDLDEGGSGALTNSVPLIRANLRHARGNRGAGVVVGILDSGIDTDHPDLADALVGQACFGDNNGSIDGTGFCPNGSDRQTGAGAAEDDAGHGTHVSGIVASNGGVSGTGVAPDASIFAIKVTNNCSFSGCFSYVSEIVAALDYVLTNRQFNIQIINMSLGTNARYAGNCDAADAGTMASAAAVNALRTAGVITFASAGNNASDVDMPLPACLTNVISVGATDNNDVIANFSNITSTTDILAPGVSIVSDAIGGGTTTASGTSMASPTAAGCAALLIQSGDATTPATIETRLETSSITATRAGVTLPRIDCSPTNTAPTVSANQASVTVNEGIAAANTGVFADANNDPVTLSASVGTITPGSGTWSWSYGTVDGPAQSQTVTVTANDGVGGVTSTTFALVVNNVNPTVNAGANGTLISNQVLNFSGTFSDPGTNDAPWSWSIDWGFGTPTTGSTSSQAAAITGSKQYCAVGSYTITLRVTDKDNGTGTASRTVQVTAIPVTVDVRQASVNLGSNGLLPVAVLSSATFDATTLNPATVVLGNGSGTDTPVAKRKNGRYYTSVEDVNGDGRADLVLQFEIPALVANGDITLASTSLTLRGILANGCSNVSGTDAIKVVP